MKEHIPVLLSEVLNTFEGVLDKNDLVVDATLGRGGHFFNLASHFNNLIAIDADKTSVDFVAKKLINNGFEEVDNRFTKDSKNIQILQLNFANLHEYLSRNNLQPKGVLVDLGISMFHYKESMRGFSFLNLSEELDMRIDTENNLVKAKDLLNKLPEKDLERLLIGLGEEYKARNYANLIVNYRNHAKIHTVSDLLSALKIDPNRKYKIHPATKVFMALRIATNSEHLNLKELLVSFEKDLNQGLLFLIITFHSLEEKTIENFCKDKNLSFKKLYPTNEEIIKNKSSRSSKLFVIKNV